MTMQHLENELRISGDPRKQALADVIAGIHKLLGSDIPFPSVATPVEKQVVKPAETIRIYPEIPLEAEWNRQAQNLAGLFAKELGFKTPEEYVATLPKFESQPENWKGRLDTPVLVETRISTERQCELAGINYASDGLRKADWNKELKGYKTPDAPYATWLDDGRNHMNIKPRDVRKNLRADELGGTELDGIALYISDPKILKHHYLDLPGTAVESDYAAYLDLWLGRPRLCCRLVVSTDPGFGSVVRGRQK